MAEDRVAAAPQVTLPTIGSRMVAREYELRGLAGGPGLLLCRRCDHCGLLFPFLPLLGRSG